MFVEILDKFVKGTALCVCADNLKIAGFHESFNVEFFFADFVVSIATKLQLLKQGIFN